MKKDIYITFGQSHYFKLDSGIVLNSDTILKIEGETHEDARKIIFDITHGKFATSYEEQPNISYFPGGVITLPESEKGKKYPKLESVWFTPQGKNIGIVYYTNDSGQKKAYIGVSLGVNQMMDEVYIKEYGTSFPLETAETIVKHYKDN